MTNPTKSEIGDQVNQPQQEAQNVSSAQISHLVSKIKNLEQQIGEHVVQALRHPDTVAVLTTVVAGPTGEQHIISASLNPAAMAQINVLLNQANEQREEEEICLGFHCLIKPKPLPS